MDPIKVEEQLQVTRRKGCSITGQISQLAKDDFDSLDSSSDQKREDNKKSKKRNKINLGELLGVDFLGVLKNIPMEEKKQKIIEVYMQFFRFSVERVKNIMESPITMSIILEYLLGT